MLKVIEKWRAKKPISFFTFLAVSYTFLIGWLFYSTTFMGTTPENKITTLTILSAFIAANVTFWFMAESGNDGRRFHDETRTNNFANLFIKFGEVMGGNKSQIEVMAAIKSMHCYINNDDEHIQQVIDILKEYIINHSDFGNGFDTENHEQKAIFAALNCLNDFGKMQNQKINIDSLMLKGKRDVIDSYEYIGGVIII